jgi:hypothetical protein
LADWLRLERAVPVRKAVLLLPSEPGKYAFFVNSLADLPEAFRVEANTRFAPQLLYVGKADKSLLVRVWEQECQHKRPGTFFRSVGAMLGYMSPQGGKNFEFARDDKTRVIEWIASRLLVAWGVTPAPGSHLITERALIKQHAPLLNIASNPKKFRELQLLRAMCQAGQSRPPKQSAGRY